jgi:hypothetical protein
VSTGEKGVEAEDVHDDGAEDDEAEGDGTSDEHEQTTEKLKEADVMHPASGEHDGHELFGRRAGGRWLHRQEGMEKVGAEDDEHQAEEDAAEEVEIFHGGRDSLREVVERGSRTL